MPKGVEKTKKEKKHFMKDVKAELKRVIWPTPKQLVNNTVAVITIVLITALIVCILDFTFEQINTYGIEKIKTSVESKNEITNSQENTNQTNEAQSNEENTNSTVNTNTAENTTNETTENE